LSTTEPPIAGRHCAPNNRPRHIDSMRILGIGAFIPDVLPAAQFRLRAGVWDPQSSAAEGKYGSCRV
jgi:hypothetical protein